MTGKIDNDLGDTPAPDLEFYLGYTAQTRLWRVIWKDVSFDMDSYALHIRKRDGETGEQTARRIAANIILTISDLAPIDWPNRKVGYTDDW